MAPKNIKLIYFDARGRGEIIRLVLAAAGQQYEDIRHTKETWPAEKPNTPFGQAPCLEVDGKRYGQSVAIANYLAREFGFYGKTNLDGLLIDQVVNLILDYYNVVIKWYYETDETKKAEIKKNVQDVESPKYMAFFEKLLKENGTGYFAGNSLSLADIFVFDLVDSLGRLKIISVDGFPLVEGVVKKVESNENIKAYLAIRKDEPVNQ